jgi:hypothetical protein
MFPCPICLSNNALERLSCLRQPGQDACQSYLLGGFSTDG